MNPSQFKPFK